MLDSDVALLFGYETKYLNRQVQSNIERFPENYCFQLTNQEYDFLRCQNGHLKETGKGHHRKYLPYVREGSDKYCCTHLTENANYDIICKIEDLF